MIEIHLKGQINEQGQLEIELPDGLTPGEVEVTIEMKEPSELPWELRPWTASELADLMRVEPKSGAEIIVQIEQGGGWEDQGITSGADWVEEQRRRNQRDLPLW
jgi:hypothetical protein